MGRVSKDVMERYEADKALAAEYDDRLTAAAAAERELRQAQAEPGHDDAGLRALAKALDAALLSVLRTAEAAERVAMGPKTYGTDDPGQSRAAEIARRRATAKEPVRRWTDEVDRLRTAREVSKLSYRAVARV